MSKVSHSALWTNCLFAFLSFTVNNQLTQSDDTYAASPQSEGNILRLRLEKQNKEDSTMLKQQFIYEVQHRSIRSTNTTESSFPIEHPKLKYFCPKIYSCSSDCPIETVYTRFSSFHSQSGRSSRGCYCDQACNDVFLDCCSNYQQSCSINRSRSVKMDKFYKLKSSWRCIPITMNTGNCLKPGSQSWMMMVAQCPNTWPNDDVKTKCHNPATSFDAQSLQLFLPVVGLANLLTYRNKYCALCNNVTTYEFLTLTFKGEAIPPPYYTPNDLSQFIANNHQYFNGLRPKENQLIRWCFHSQVISTCPNTTSEQDLHNCLHGIVGLVEDLGTNKIFKNKACAKCNGYIACGLAPKSGNSGGCSIDDSAISRAIRLRDYGFTTTTKSCRKNEVYDKFLGKCRQIYVINRLDTGNVDVYQVILSVLRKDRISIPRFFQGELRLALSKYYKVNETKIAKVKMENFHGITPETFITFHILLTQSQSLILASNMNLNGTSNDTITLRRLFRFRTAFELEFGRYPLTIYRQQIRQTNCTRTHVYQSKEFVFLDDLRIHVLSTGAIYEQFEYYMNSSVVNSSVTVCLKSVPTQCNGSYIKLNSSEFHFTENLTLVYKLLAYRLGDYLYDNGMVFICVNFARHYRTVIPKSVSNDLALVILTWIGFILSIIGLLLLFVTYVIFKDLRTLPGKNLMNLCLSLCLAEIFWLIGSILDSYPTTCTAVAIADHYFFLVFFTASSVIAFHSCLVFGRKIAFRRSSSDGNKMFIIYSLVVWGIPAFFLLIFGLLDHYNVFIIDYGKSVVCWLGNRKSKFFLFIVPFGILLLFNLVLFLLVATRLRDNVKSSAKVLGPEAKKRETQNVKICLKLSTLMGFSWLFGLLQVAVETGTDVFAYLFIIFVSFQGLFICAAFLFQRKCYQLYNSLLSGSSNNNARQTPRFSDSRVIKDTKL